MLSVARKHKETEKGNTQREESQENFFFFFTTAVLLFCHFMTAHQDRLAEVRIQTGRHTGILVDDTLPQKYGSWMDGPTYPAVVAGQEVQGLAVADQKNSAEPWEVAGRRDSEVTGMHLFLGNTHILIWVKYTNNHE